jgi:two-component system chemotaxis sensor kinase CheA
VTAIRQRLLDVFELEYQDHLGAIRTILAKRDSAGIASADVAEAMRRAHSLKGAARAVGLDDVETLAHGLEALFIRIERGETRLDPDVVRHVGDVLDEIEDRVVVSRAAEAPPPDGANGATARSGEQRPTVTPSTAQPRPTAVRLEAGDLDQLLKSAGELRSDLLLQRANSQTLRSIASETHALEEQWTSLWKDLESTQDPQSSRRVSPRVAEQGDRLAARIKSLARQTAAAANAQDHGARHLFRHVDELESRVKSARMVPAEGVFGGFRKMVRDVAASEGKQVEVVIDGLECQADRLALQRIKDPVMHMLRNAVSHGIESPAERQRNGKTAAGHVGLRITTARDRLSIIVEDDGRGIARNGIADKAVSLKLMSRVEADAASDEALRQLLFEPGFSTAAAVTRISGRGVGLSVAREAVAGLQGTLTIRSQPGAGTRIDVSLPASILSRRLLQVTFRQQTYALPADAVAKVARIPLKDIVTIEGRPAAQVDGVMLPLMSIGHILHCGDEITTIDREHACLVVLRTGDARIGVVVESFVGVSEFVVRMLDVGAGQRLWSGIIRTEDGAPCLVLNADAFAAGANRSGIVFRARGAQADATKVVLVVDDSITTRTLEKSILEANGYKVRLSVDGRDAIAQLRTQAADIVVSDIEMPHLNGFELVEAMKRDRALAAIPVVLVTSRDDPADKERGLMLGADAYVVKQRFDQHELLRTIRQFI